MAIQPDNMVLVGGSFPGSDGYNDLGVARFNVDGSLDTGFNGSGYTTLSTGLYQASSAYGMAVQPDGGITVAGTSGDLANPADLSNTALLARITAGDIGRAQVSVDNASPSLPLSGAGYVAAGDTYSLTLGSPLTPGEGGAPAQWVDEGGSGEGNRPWLRDRRLVYCQLGRRHRPDDDYRRRSGRRRRPGDAHVLQHSRHAESPST